jgi:DNA repair photolyase
VDLDHYLLALIAPLGVGDEVMEGARIAALSTELGLRITVGIGGREVHLEITRIEDGGAFAARTDRFLFRYRSSGGRDAVDPALGLALCRAVAARVARREDVVLSAIEREAASAQESEDSGARVRQVRVSSVLVPAGVPGERYHTLSPYVGCLVGCRFCYAQSRVAEGRRLAHLPEAPWGSYVDVRVNAPDVLAGELERSPAWPIKFCPIVSDPYQAVERRFGVMRACLEVLGAATRPRPVFVLTRSRLIERDLDVIAALPRAFVGISIPTIDDEVRRHFEPRGASIPERLAILETFARAGIDTFAVVQPILPGSIPRLVAELARLVRSVSIDVLRGTFGAAGDFADPRYEHARDAEWQRARAEEIAADFGVRGVQVWSGELPPGIAVE